MRDLLQEPLCVAVLMHWIFKANFYKTLAWQSSNSCCNLSSSFKCEPNLRKLLVTLLSSHTQFCHLSWSVCETCSIASLSLSMIFMCLHWRHYRENFLGPTCHIIPVLSCGITAAKEKPCTLPGIPAQCITDDMHAPSWELLWWHLPGPLPWVPEFILPSKTLHGSLSCVRDGGPKKGCDNPLLTSPSPFDGYMTPRAVCRSGWVWRYNICKRWRYNICKSFL